MIGMDTISVLWIIRILFTLFMAVLFLQSGIDKITDWQGNLEWLTQHFAASPLAGVVPAMLATVAVVELVAGGLAAAGVALLLISGDPALATVAAAVAGAVLVMLFFGQRLAKDYEGAAVLATYFILDLLGLYFLQL